MADGGHGWEACFSNGAKDIYSSIAARQMVRHNHGQSIPAPSGTMPSPPIASLLLEPLFMMPFVLLTSKFLLGVLMIGFWIWILSDAATKEPAAGHQRLAWVLVILFTTWIGAAIYFIARRPERLRKYGR